MKFKIIPSNLFLRQLKELDDKSKKTVNKKIELIKENPYRNKKVHTKSFSKVFRVRLNLQKQERRLIYLVIEPNIILAFFLNRKKDYKDLEKNLKKI